MDSWSPLVRSWSPLMDSTSVEFPFLVSESCLNLALFGHLRGQRQPDHSLQTCRRTIVGRSPHHCHDVPNDLYRRDEQAPGDTPPAKDERKGGVAQLALDATSSAGNPRGVLPRRQKDRRPDPIGDVDIDGSRALALRTGAVVNGPRPLLHQVRRQPPGRMISDPLL